MVKILKRLINQVAVITGVADKSSIGYAIAEKLAEEGARINIIDIQSQVLDREKDLSVLNSGVNGYIADLTKKERVIQVFQKIKERCKKIEILVNCAGKSVPPRPPFKDMSEEYFDKVMDRNLKTTFQCCKAVIPQMIDQNYGKIVNISSISGPMVVYRFSAAYAASKGAVSALTRALALEYGEFNINVNAVLPGMIHTSETHWTPENDTYKFKKTHPALKWPIHGPGFPRDVANAVLFLSTDESRYITGQELVVDGGACLVEPVPSPDDLFLYDNAPK
jgi:NAD(P)-dependent dehydrogenase (short-subunit alcohol dehydrogenase family)